MILRNAQERAESRTYQGFPGWEKIELVQEGVINPNLPYSQALKTDLTNFQNLQLRDFHIQNQMIFVGENSYSIPFAVSIRYQKRGNFLTQRVQQGTLEIRGELMVYIDHFRDSIGSYSQ